MRDSLAWWRHDRWFPGRGVLARPGSESVCRPTDLLVDVDSWYGFSDRFTHQKTGEPAKEKRVLYAALVADGVDSGPAKMAEDESGYGSHHSVKLPTIVYSR